MLYDIVLNSIAVTIITLLPHNKDKCLHPQKPCSTNYRARLFGRTIAATSSSAHAANPHLKPIDLILTKFSLAVV